MRPGGAWREERRFLWDCVPREGKCGMIAIRQASVGAGGRRVLKRREVTLYIGGPWKLA